jgi:hypothetical protein
MTPSTRPSTARPAGPLAQRQADDDDPERHRGHEQRRQTGGHVLLGDDHEPVAADEQQDAHHCDRCQLTGRGSQDARPVAGRQPGGHQQPGGQEPDATPEERRDGLDHDADAEVGRPPADVDGEECRPEQPGVESSGRHRSIVGVPGRQGKCRFPLRSISSADRPRTGVVRSRSP